MLLQLSVTVSSCMLALIVLPAVCDAAELRCRKCAGPRPGSGGGGALDTLSSAVAGQLAEFDCDKTCTLANGGFWQTTFTDGSKEEMWFLGCTDPKNANIQTNAEVKAAVDKWSGTGCDNATVFTKVDNTGISAIKTDFPADDAFTKVANTLKTKKKVKETKIGLCYCNTDKCFSGAGANVPYLTITILSFAICKLVVY